MPTPSSKPRLVHIDLMIGLAMIFVVLGHFSLGFEPHWYHFGLHNWIYSFHMQLFLFLSAFLIRYTYKGVQNLKDYGLYIWRKFKKFFIWFILIGLAIDLLACPIKGVPFSASYLWQSLRTLLLYPRWSEASFLWYIYILFGYYLISPLFFRLPQWVKTLCCVAALFLPMLTASVFLDAYDFCQYTFFYCLGVLCAEWIEDIRNAKTWLWALLSLPFVAFSVWLFAQGQFLGFEHPNLGWWAVVTGVASIPFFYLLSMALIKSKLLSRLLSAISKNCYWIYLLQMFIIWICARIVHTSIHAGTISFTPFFIVTAILALALPIALSWLYHLIAAKLQAKKSRAPFVSSPAKNTSLK